MRRYQTGIMISVNKAPVTFYSLRQNSVVTSNFGSEFTSMKQGVDLLESLQYTLCIFGMPIEGPESVYFDHEDVYKKIEVPSSVIRKKMHSITYLFLRGSGRRNC